MHNPINNYICTKFNTTMNKKKIVLSAISVLALIGLIFIGSVYYVFFSHQFGIDKTAYIYIDKNDNIDSVMQKIDLVGNPGNMYGFKYLSKKNNYPQHIKTGKYEIKPNDNVRYLFRKLSKGYQSPVNLTIPSVRTLDKLVKSLSKQLMIDSLELSKVLNDSALIAQNGYNIHTLPALFIPNTYEVYWDISGKDIFERMIKENKNFWNNDRIKKAEELKLTPIEVSTLASIVEEETANNKEKPMVAGLYLNRLKRGMLLQADPTVKFGLQDFTLRRILNKHLLVNSPYNTYKYAGLPPGPIRIPSIIGIESVLNYSRHNYLYMCAKEDFSGTHNFAENVAQHQINARKYQQALNIRNIK